MQLWKHPLLALAALEPDPLKPRFSGHDISAARKWLHRCHG